MSWMDTDVLLKLRKANGRTDPFGASLRSKRFRTPEAQGSINATGRSDDQELFVSQIWSLLPPTRGQIKDIGGGSLETSIGTDLESSLETG